MKLSMVCLACSAAAPVLVQDSEQGRTKEWPCIYCMGGVCVREALVLCCMGKCAQFAGCVCLHCLGRFLILLASNLKRQLVSIVELAV